MSVAIKDVARETGLSPATISKYLNGKKIREENRALIEKAIQKLDYRPNKFARGLRMAKSHTIGVIIYRFKDVFSAKIAGCIEYCLREKGYSIILWSHEGDPEQASEGIAFMLRNQVEGLIVEPIPGHQELYDGIYGKIPVVSVDSPLDMKRYDSVMSNTMLGVYQGVEYLIDKGHGRIAIISAGLHSTEGMESGLERLKGYYRAMEDYQLPLREEWIVKGRFSFRSGYEGMKKIWESPEHPTAIIAANYTICMGMMKALHELSVNVPEDLSVISVDDMIFSEICTPKLTSIGQSVEEIARKTVEIMMKRIEGDYSDFPKTLKIHTIFMERESVRERKKNQTVFENGGIDYGCEET